MPLGERIKEHRKKCGMSQEKVAELVGVSRQAVTKWESGQSAPSTENLFKLAEIFGTTVDLLLDSPEQEQCPPAEPICGLNKTGHDLRSRRKTNFFRALSIAGGYMVIYLLGRIIWCDPTESSVVGWLFLARPKGAHSYLYGWLLSSNLFWISLGVSALPAIWGRIKFSLTTLAGFVLGMLAGILFGPNPAGAAMGQSHYGWLIWGAIYLLSVIVGILAERFVRKGRR